MMPALSKGRFAVLSFSAILSLCLTASAQVKVTHTSQYLNNSSFSWRIFIAPDDPLLSSIACVEYQLDPSFARSVRSVCKLGDPRFPFAESGEALKTFKVGVTVKFNKSRVPSYVAYTVTLSREIAVTKQVRVKSNTSKVLDQNPFQNQVAIYVSGGNPKNYRLKIYENFGTQRAFFESQIYLEAIAVGFKFNGQQYLLRGSTRGVGSAFDLACTVYRVVIK